MSGVLNLLPLAPAIAILVILGPAVMRDARDHLTRKDLPE